jgi:hypothetical protein
LINKCEYKYKAFIIPRQIYFVKKVLKDSTSFSSYLPAEFQGNTSAAPAGILFGKSF